MRTVTSDILGRRTNRYASPLPIRSAAEAVTVVVTSLSQRVVGVQPTSFVLGLVDAHLDFVGSAARSFSV